MDLPRLRAQLTQDEGRRLRVYADTRGILTVGIGHRVLPEDDLAAGDRISAARCAALFAADLDRTIAGCAQRLEGWALFPPRAQEILVNMAFNLGVSGLLQFRATLRHIRARAYREAAAGMRQSLWYGQVGARAERLAQQMEGLEKTMGYGDV